MFLANENFPKPSILLLREHGYTVRSIQEESQGIADDLVVERAIAENLIILTFDKDYGELIFRYAHPTPPSVIYFRDKGSSPLFAGQLLLNILDEGLIRFEKAFSVIEKSGIRQRFYFKQ